MSSGAPARSHVRELFHGTSMPVLKTSPSPPLGNSPRPRLWSRLSLRARGAPSPLPPHHHQKKHTHVHAPGSGRRPRRTCRGTAAAAAPQLPPAARPARHPRPAVPPAAGLDPAEAGGPSPQTMPCGEEGPSGGVQARVMEAGRWSMPRAGRQTSICRAARMHDGRLLQQQPGTVPLPRP